MSEFDRELDLPTREVIKGQLKRYESQLNPNIKLDIPIGEELVRIAREHSWLNLATVERMLRENDSRAHLIAYPVGMLPADMFAALPHREDVRLPYFAMIATAGIQNVLGILLASGMDATENLRRLEQAGFPIAPEGSQSARQYKAKSN